tara:strand:+ start:21451 stop:21588 length:138 start_codon:yes stop_codon:yes gene_type:complete
MSNWEDWWDYLPYHPANQTEDDDYVYEEDAEDEDDTGELDTRHKK